MNIKKDYKAKAIQELGEMSDLDLFNIIIRQISKGQIYADQVHIDLCIEKMRDRLVHTSGDELCLKQERCTHPNHLWRGSQASCSECGKIL